MAVYNHNVNIEYIVGRKKKLKIVILGVIIFASGVVLGGFGLRVINNKIAQEQQAKYDLLSRRVLIENPNDILLDFTPLKKELESYAANTVGKDKMSLYFEYLPTGSSIGINENKESVGASLLKLPVVINVYKLAEEGRLDLDRTVSIEKQWLNSSYGSLYKKGEGYELTIRRAAQYALEESDNTAVLLLMDMIARAPGGMQNGLFDFVDINYDVGSDDTVLIGSQAYASMLKCLYFSCFLNKDDSQEVLYHLTQATAKDRLAKSIPAGLDVAHKIGTFKEQTQSDCGIIYLDKRNYLLCIMVDEGEAEGSRHIAKVSQIVYEFLAPAEPATAQKEN